MSHGSSNSFEISPEKRQVTKKVMTVYIRTSVSDEGKSYSTVISPSISLITEASPEPSLSPATVTATLNRNCSASDPAPEHKEAVEHRSSDKEECYGFKLVGDNIDKTMNMRLQHQAQSLHYFNVYAVRDRSTSSN